MFIILGGLPGVGKSTVAKKLAGKIKAVYLRIDTIEQAIKNTNTDFPVFSEGYMTAYAIAKENLELGLNVIADSVNPIEVTRQDYRQVAKQSKVPYIEIELVCSDSTQHKNRIEVRQSSVTNLKLPTWQDVLDREYEIWHSADMIIDTAINSSVLAVDMIITEIKKRGCMVMNGSV